MCYVLLCSCDSGRHFPKMNLEPQLVGNTYCMVVKVVSTDSE